MDDGAAVRKAETLEHTRGGGSGTAEAGGGGARQTFTAQTRVGGGQTPVLLEEVLRRENLTRAYARVVSNRGASGVDGITVGEFKGYLREHWPRVREALLSETYRPQPVRQVEIPKPTGGVRMLGIPTVLDRFIQQALLQVLQPVIDPTFSDASFGFRPRRSAHDAVQRAQQHVAAGYRWVVDLDLEKFFDRVNHDVLMARVARRVSDKRVLRLIRRFLQAGIMTGGLTSPRTEGTPQGGPLSPLLSNILLDDLDRELERRGHRFVRYADDCNIYVKSEHAGTRVLASLERWLWQRLRLQVNRDKSAVGRPSERKFLGYSLTSERAPRLTVAWEAVHRLKDKLRRSLRRGRGRSLGSVIEELAPQIRGWVAYFRLAQVKARFEELDAWLRRKLRRLLWKQWKRPRTRFHKLCELGLGRARAATSAYNGRGPWWNAGASPMNQAVPNVLLTRWGLLSFLSEHRRLSYSS
ncbi:MAG TPA: group II intron reverse transcriptase/maturase [Thermoleophilaceae bacterium]|nr:group II intron reverse transcriptase/maturase [Thermoleophilaceae bacterium]